MNIDIAFFKSKMYVFGGLIDGELSRTSEKLSGNEWTSGPSMPEGRSRCMTIRIKIGGRGV